MTDELDAIRARHEAAKQAIDDDRFYSSPNGRPPPSFSDLGGKQAHTDRATLLRLLDAERARRVRVEEAAKDANWCGRVVMEMLDEHGGGIVPHLIDTDDNAGQRFRNSLDRLAAALQEKAP